MRGVLGGLAFVAMAVTMGAVSPVAQAQRGTIDCGSGDNKPGRCPVRWRDAQLVRQDSKAACVRDRTWGFDQQANAIWVDRGCRGIFAEAGGWGGGRPGGDDRPGWDNGRPGWDDSRPGPGPGWGGGGPQRTIDCGSRNGGYGHCDVDTRFGRPRLIRQNSDARCQEGYSWGVDRDGIWVDKGCRGIFSVGGR
jgi:hypothetical protein